MVLKYQEIARDIATKIFNHTFVEKLPSEAELMKMYLVSRNTIRSAINVLHNQGIISRIQGSGYFVSTPLHSGQNLMNLANKVGMNAFHKDYPVVSTILKLETKVAGNKIAKFLKCDPSSSIYYIKRLRKIKDELFSLERAYYLREVVPYLPEEACQNSIFAFITENYNVEIKTADEYVSLHRLTKDEATLANLPENSPTLRIEELNYLKNEQPFNYSTSDYFQEDLTFYYHISNYLH